MDELEARPLDYEGCHFCTSQEYKAVGERTRNGRWFQCAECSRWTWRKHVSAQDRDVAYNAQEIKEKWDKLGYPVLRPNGYLEYPNGLLVPTDAALERLEKEARRQPQAS